MARFVTAGIQKWLQRLQLGRDSNFTTSIYRSGAQAKIRQQKDPKEAEMRGRDRESSKLWNFGSRDVPCYGLAKPFTCWKRINSDQHQIFKLHLLRGPKKLQPKVPLHPHQKLQVRLSFTRLKTNTHKRHKNIRNHVFRSTRQHSKSSRKANSRLKPKEGLHRCSFS